MGSNAGFHHQLPFPFSIALCPIPSLLHRSLLLRATMLHRTQGNDLRADNTVLSLGLVHGNRIVIEFAGAVRMFNKNLSAGQFFIDISMACTSPYFLLVRLTTRLFQGLFSLGLCTGMKSAFS